MISVFLNCSSPYVGFTIRQADYVNNTMHLCTLKEPIMPADCYELFNNGGSTLLLGKFGRYRYLQATQTTTENYDEQGRRIYASVAFVSDKPEDLIVINRIAAYVFFNENNFYEEIAKMIILLKDGFTVDFDQLSVFMKRFERETHFRCTTEKAKHVYQSILSSAGKYDIDLVVLEATWDYLVNQVGRKFTKNDVCCFTEEKAKAVAEKGRMEFKTVSANEKPAQKATEEKPVEEKTAEEKTAEEKTAEEKTAEEKTAEEKTAEEKTAEEKPAAETPVEEKAAEEKKEQPTEKIQEQTSDAGNGAQEQLCKLQTEHFEQKKLLESAEKKVSSLAAEIQLLKDQLKKRFLLGLTIGIIGAVLAVLMVSCFASGAEKEEAVSTKHIAAADGFVICSGVYDWEGEV